ncbi:MAG: asparagine synthase (glutamine-hydrolyzing) [Gemmataceae bacterium]
MCGIAGAIDLRGQRSFPRERIEAMTRALAHRGPDDDQIHEEPGIALGVRRLAIIDVNGGRQPLSNEDGTVWVACEGELYDFPELFESLRQADHKLGSRCDTELWVHLYEDHKEGVFDLVRGQFAVSLWDRKRRTLLLGRDRPGIAPLFYTEADGWLLWASEIKALLASGLVRPRPDLRALNYFFNFYSLPNDYTCFVGIRSIRPGNYLKIRDGLVLSRQYWDLDFPDAGDEERYARPQEAIDELENLLTEAVRRRFLSERPVCTYLSGGLDSTALLGLATRVCGGSVPSFTVGLDRAGPYDERSAASYTAQLLNSPLTTVTMTSRDIAEAYPEVIRAGEGPVLDTAAACTVRLAQTVRRNGFVVALSGEGSDESLAGYIWFKIDRLIRMGGPSFYGAVRWFLLSVLARGGSKHRPPFAPTAGVRTGQQFPYEMMAQSRETLFAPEMWRQLDDHCPYEDLDLPRERMVRWHPLNQGLYLSHKIMLPGSLLAAKGDRAMHNSSIEGRFPFLDEDVVNFCARLDPRFKLRGLTDKWLLRQVTARILPPQIANRPKTMFRAHFGGSFLGEDRPAYVDQLLSPESLRKTGYFRHDGVELARQVLARKSRFSFNRFVLEMGMAGVIATQLWHHIYCGGALAELPTYTPPSFDDQPVPDLAPSLLAGSPAPALA